MEWMPPSVNAPRNRLVGLAKAMQSTENGDWCNLDNRECLQIALETTKYRFGRSAVTDDEVEAYRSWVALEQYRLTVCTSFNEKFQEFLQ